VELQRDHFEKQHRAELEQQRVESNSQMQQMQAECSAEVLTLKQKLSAAQAAAEQADASRASLEEELRAAKLSANPEKPTQSEPVSSDVQLKLNKAMELLKKYKKQVRRSPQPDYIACG
jgi:hypothetical protein